MRALVKRTPLTRAPGAVAKAIHALVAQVPASMEAASADPNARAKTLAEIAALKAGAVSGSFTLPPGPLGFATVLPDLLAIWRIQQQLVADIAAAFGRSSALTPETMVICLFKHGGAALTQGLLSRSGRDVLVHRITQRTLLQLLEKIAVRLMQRAAAKSVLRWLPVLGAVGAGAYAYYDTRHVAANALELFSGNLQLTDAPTPSPPGEPDPQSTRSTSRRKASNRASRRIPSRKGSRKP